MGPLTLELRRFIVDNFLFGDDSGRFTFTDEDSFQERGIVDSTGILELLCHVQETYGITVPDEELIPENFDSIARLAGYITRKQGGAVAADAC